MAADVFIIGGGPAGLAAALAARRKGLSVTVADCAAPPAWPPADKACGEVLMPDGLAALRTLGVEVEPAGSFPLRGVRFFDSGLQVEADFPDGPACGIRRTILHHVLVEHAEAAGVSMVWDAEIAGIVNDGVRVDGRLLPCRWIIGADGEDSLVRSWSGLTAQWRGRRRFGFGRHYRLESESTAGCVELYWGQSCQVRVTPVARDVVCVFGLSEDPQLCLDHALAEVPELAERLQNGDVLTSESRAVLVSRKLVDVQRGSVGLIGDASGSVDPIAGEGLGLAFRQALELGEALERGDLDYYQERHTRIGESPRRIARLLLALARYPVLRHAVMRGLAGNPRFFSTLLEMRIFSEPAAE